ncbi:MAG TPA: LamG-like jellyroll fold domain-containing protein [Thermoanaerobaculia bacterium]|nr:LamG-like jellyroll fold domain-containing protein [Thermoanaerobaculia bacterium]
MKPPTSVGAEGTGPISFLTFYPPSPSHMLCGSTIGGLWYSTNGGAFWFKTGTDTEIARSGVGTAAFHPTDYHTWFAASSGNNDGEPGWIGLTGGISLTRDEGKTWKQIASQANLGGIWTRVFKIVVDPSNPSRLYAATSNGLFITNNALAGIPVWTVVPGLAGEYVYDFNLRPGAPNCLYAAVATWSGSNLINWRYLYSTNTTTWQDVPGQSAQTLGAIRLLIEVTPAKTDNFYALVIPPGGSPSKLLFYDFGNNQWHVIYGSAQITAAGRHAFGVDRANPNIVYLSEGTEGRRYTYQGTPLFIDFHSTYYSTGTYHPDIECLVPHPYTTNEVWMCHHGGVSVSLNSGQSWKDRTTGIGGAQVIRLADAASDPSYVAVGLYHDGTDVTASTHSPLWAPNWRQFPNAFCDGLRPLIDPTNPGYMWESCQWGAWMMSTDTGATFVGNGPPSPMWVAEAAFNHLNPATQFRLGTGSGGYDTVFRTTDRFTTWDQIVDLHALYPGPFIAWKIYTPETNGNHLLVHLVDKQNSINKLYRTTIANASTASLMSPSAWTELPLPDNRWISAIAFDPVNPNIVYIANSSSSAFSNSATGTHMLFKVDYTNPALHTYNACTPGLCEDLTQNLPNAYTGQDTLAVEQNSNGGIYFGTDFGVFYSDQSSRAAGSGWAELGTSLPHAGSSGVAINTPSRMVRVGTNGRGVWEHDLVSTALTSCTPPPPDMTAWWTFDGGTGAQMHDLVGSDNVGTTINGPAAVTGIVAGALHFNGTNQFVSAAPQADLNVGSGDFAIDAWIRTSGSGVQTIVDKRNAVPVGYTLFLFNGRLGLQMGDRIGSSVCSSNNTSSACTNWITPATWPNAADGNWHHVAASVSRNNATGGRLYVDGWLVLMFDPTIRNQSIDNTTALWIASSHANSSAGQGFFSGDIDEVEIFKRAVTAAEVQAIFNAGGFGKCKCGGNPSNC